MQDPLGMGMDHHARHNGMHARANQAFGALHLHHAHAAGAVRVHILEVTERWNLDAGTLAGIENADSSFHGDGFPIDGTADHLLIHCSPPEF